jgi:hypothetical protein
MRLCRLADGRVAPVSEDAQTKYEPDAELQLFRLYESAGLVALVPEFGEDHAPSLMVRRLGAGRVVACGKIQAQGDDIPKRQHQHTNPFWEKP